MNDNARSNPLLPLDLLAAGDPRFVVALRVVADSAALANFAAPWLTDRRPEARTLLFAYLDQPPNAPGHEGLIKRLFKLAEAAGDDEVMARFLVLCDRLIDRGRSSRLRFASQSFATIEEAKAQGLTWIAQGWFKVIWKKNDSPLVDLTKPYFARGRYRITTGSARKTTLPRPNSREGEALASLTDAERARRRWFSVATRRYLQRRAWRYFRKLGQTDPARYIAAAEIALNLYRDAELAAGFALLDHNGLMRLLFGHSPVLRFESSGCELNPGRTLAELAPSPAFASIWHDHPEVVVQLLGAQAALVARWAIRWIEADRERFAALGSGTSWVDRLDHADPAVVALALAMLARRTPDRVRTEVPPERWARVAHGAAPANRAVVADFVRRVVHAGAVARADAVELALSADEALARLGWNWIEGQGVATPRAGDDPGADARELLRLVDAEFAPLRPVILRVIRAGLAGWAERRPDWVWTLLASRHADARAAGWAWFQAEPMFRADPELWGKLVASPYPDIRAACATVAGPVPVDPDRLDEVRAAVLLAPHGTARIKPGVIRRVAARLETTAAEAEVDGLLRLLATVARSAHAPERRAALAALIGLVERRPEWLGRVEALVPGLQIDGGLAIVPT